MAVSALIDFQRAELALERVQAELDALPATELSPMNVDLVSATSIALGVADRVLGYRDRMLPLPEFRMSSVDSLVDYAQATWFLYVNNLPVTEASEAATLIAEVTELRAKLLLWAGPLAASGKFEPAAIERIREGSGQKDTASDLVALVGLYRAKWDEVKAMCGVTEGDLERSASIGSAVFMIVSRRENKLASGPSDGSLRVRRAWTLLDRAYSQCRRALQFLRFDEGDADSIAPSLRRNAGPGKASNSAEVVPPVAAQPVPSVIDTTAAAPAAASTARVGGASVPFDDSTN
jgi:hypothetical protein